MRTQLRILAAVLCLANWISCDAASCSKWPKKIYLLRHAERMDSTDDSPLSPVGWRRAGGLPLALDGVSLSTIIVSEKQRTQQTAMALAAHTNLRPEVMPADVDGLAKKICDAGANSADKAVVVVGHSTTIPKIIQAVISAWTGTIDGDSFGDLFIIDTESGTVDQKRYGDCQQ